jgi:hypothetical protein
MYGKNIQLSEFISLHPKLIPKKPPSLTPSKIIIHLPFNDLFDLKSNNPEGKVQLEFFRQHSKKCLKTNVL